MSRKLIIFIGIFYLVGIIGMSIGPYKSFFVGLSFFHLLLSFGILLLGRHKQSSTLWLFIGCAFAIGMLVEWIGVHTGLLFGTYKYGAVLGPKVASVPLIIGVNWAMLSIVSAALLATLKLNFWLEVVVSALLMVFLDFLMEPVAIKLGFWNWKNGVIPFYNYVCWFATALLIQFIYRKWRLNEANNVAVALFIYLTIFFTFLTIRL
ncbi:MAG: carotenoid biosynthesis protein [Flavobacteriales bacterium]